MRRLLSLQPFSLSFLTLVLLALPSEAQARTWKEVDRREHLDAIREQLDSGQWNEAAKLIARAERAILERSRPKRNDDRALAELALYVAVVEANSGDPNAAEWYWYTAFNLHQPTAYGDISAWGRAAEVLGAIVVRDLGRDPKEIKSFRRFPNSDFEEPRSPTIKAPGSIGPSHELAEVRSFQVELFLDDTGQPHAPRLLGRLQLPIFFYSMLKQFHEKKWRPARSQGKPVAMLVEVTQAPKVDRW
ncbi:MAG: hypothetical protein MPN21_14430 [Thermoanaerobaculia bacterium]|nr:hypothetical protein [Thermoanaerobaculia bacterium]